MQRIWRAQARLRRLLRVVRRVRRQLRDDVLDAQNRLLESRNPRAEEPSDTEEHRHQPLGRPSEEPLNRVRKERPGRMQQAEQNRRLAVEEFQKVARRDRDLKSRDVLRGAAFRRSRAGRLDTAIPDDEAGPMSDPADDSGLG